MQFSALLFAAAAAESEMPEAGILHLDKELLIEMAVQWVNIILLVVVLAFVLYKPVKKFMNARAERIKNHLDNAAQEENRAVELREAYEARLFDIEAERDDILQKGREAAMERGDEIISEARREAASIYRHSMEELRTEQQNQRDDMKRAIIEISTNMAGRFVQLSLDEETQNAYVDKAMERLEESLWEE